jgi:hypothetical protein
MPPKHVAIRRFPEHPLIHLCLSLAWFAHLHTCPSCRLFYISAHAPYMLDFLDDPDPEV